MAFKDWKQKKREIFITRHMTSELIADERRREQPRRECDDTRLRGEIRGVIIELVEKGQSMKEIISTLIKNSEYGKYAQYFPSWIEHYQRKKQVQKSHEDEERE